MSAARAVRCKLRPSTTIAPLPRRQDLHRVEVEFAQFGYDEIEVMDNLVNRAVAQPVSRHELGTAREQHRIFDPIDRTTGESRRTDGRIGQCPGVLRQVLLTPPRTELRRS
jgi:hypothetical protein